MASDSGGYVRSTSPAPRRIIRSRANGRSFVRGCSTYRTSLQNRPSDGMPPENFQEILDQQVVVLTEEGRRILSAGTGPAYSAYVGKLKELNPGTSDAQIAKGIKELLGPPTPEEC